MAEGRGRLRLKYHQVGDGRSRSHHSPRREADDHYRHLQHALADGRLSCSTTTAVLRRTKVERAAGGHTKTQAAATTRTATAAADAVARSSGGISVAHATGMDSHGAHAMKSSTIEAPEGGTGGPSRHARRATR